MTDEKKTDTRRYTSTAELAYANMFSGGMPEGLPSDQAGPAGQIVRAQLPISQRERLDRQIDDCMRGAIDDALHRPNPMLAGPRPQVVTPAGAGRVVSGPGEPRGTGWHDPGPLQVPGGVSAQAVIEAMTHAALPHSPEHPDYKGRGKKKEE
jgi:hypothetical protein